MPRFRGAFFLVSGIVDIAGHQGQRCSRRPSKLRTPPRDRVPELSRLINTDVMRHHVVTTLLTTIVTARTRRTPPTTGAVEPS